MRTTLTPPAARGFRVDLPRRLRVFLKRMHLTLQIRNTRAAIKDLQQRQSEYAYMDYVAEREGHNLDALEAQHAFDEAQLAFWQQHLRSLRRQRAQLGA